MPLSSIVCLLLSLCFGCLALTQSQLSKLVLQRHGTLTNTPYRYINEKRIGSIAGEPIYPQIKFRLPPKEVAISRGFVPAYERSRFHPHTAGNVEQITDPRSSFLSTLSERIPVV